MTDSSLSPPPRSSGLLDRQSSRLVVIDVQEKLLPHIPVAESLVANCRKLIRGAAVLGVPAEATEQYPKGLGPTVTELGELLATAVLPEKLRFSGAGVLAPGPAADNDRDQLVLCGIEAHVCVLQTALDLMALGYRVHVPADAVASRRKLDWQIALGRLADSGVVVTTTESVLFEWCEQAGTDEFREISRLVTDRDGA